MIQPSSPFPYSPLTLDEVERQRGYCNGTLSTFAIDEEPAPASLLQDVADLRRCRDIHIGFLRDGWPAA